ncbi:MAG: hypothetical protein JXA20_20565 [Spirochaetes bacterium]|nr:hypothetical protein [Spirochaetota bacterium]
MPRNDHRPAAVAARRRRAVALLIAGIAVSVPALRAAFIPYYRMDSLALQAEAVVLCRELSYAPRHDAPMDRMVTWRTGRFLVERTFKGIVPAGATLTVRMPGTYRRAVLEEGIPTYMLLGDGRRVLKRHRPVPLGQALLFLTWNGSERVYEPVTGGIKVISGGRVLAYGQFVSNPGPLVLAPMRPENVDAPRYGLDELLADLAVALERARGLKAPVPGEPEYRR